MSLSRNLSQLAPKVNTGGTVLASGGGTGIVSAGASGQMLTSDGTAWTSNYGIISSNLTLYVATTGNDTTGDGLTSGTAWATPHKAMAWLRDRTIGNGVTVTVTVADGDYTFTETLNLNHPQGVQIFINGTSTTGTRPVGAALNGGGVRGNTVGTQTFNNALLVAYYNTRWQFNGCTGLQCTVGGGVTVNTVLIRGNGTSFAGVYSGKISSNGDQLSSGSINFGNTVAVHNFANFALLTWGGLITASNITITNCSNGPRVILGGTIIVRNSTTSNSGSGPTIFFGGNIYATGSVSSNNAGSGLTVFNGGNLWGDGSIMTNNGQYGVRLDNAGYISVLSCTMSGNALFDIIARGSGYVAYRAGTASTFSPALDTVGNGNALIQTI
jgi:hypothetical protein